MHFFDIKAYYKTQFLRALYDKNDFMETEQRKNRSVAGDRLFAAGDDRNDLYIKAHANRRNKCQQLPTLMGVVGQQCCVRLPMGLKVRPVSNYTQQVPTSADIVVVPCKRTQQVTALLGQQCWVLLANNVGSVCMGLQRQLYGIQALVDRLCVVGQQCCVRLPMGLKVRPVSSYTQQVPTSADIVVVPCKRTQQVTALLGPTVLGVVGQQCWVRLHGSSETIIWNPGFS